eukprot:CAMPEP_0182864182 /NCGR_PEP_ID=MMETSP0034_2-20130328/7037_1 /TAXON_ID=156128 /ORGANISM="Nephroselmis pyriformis, Strain CCMP717" /LENGTH=214 /DNA_ID=CAMNT_0024996431 /DNA_START=30 /DNA_END=670 /DNA_ORIENTATION=+
MGRVAPTQIVFVIVFVLACFGLMQWRNILTGEIILARRNGKQFETLYREALDEAAEWREKFDKERRKSIALQKVKGEEDVIINNLEKKTAEEEAAISSLQSTKTQLTEDLQSAQKTINEEMKEREELLQKAGAMSDELAHAKEMKKRSEDEKNQIATLLEALKDEKTQLQAEVTNLAAARKDADEQAGALQSQVAALEAELADARKAAADAAEA